MSMKEAKRRKIAREVMRKAWTTFKRCMLSWSTCLRICWATVRSLRPVYHSKVKGVTFENRQQIIKRLSLYSVNDILLKLIRDDKNPYDANAIMVIAKVKGKGEAQIGYVSKELASKLAQLIDSGSEVLALLDSITGLTRDDCSLGVNFSFVII